MSLNKKYIKSLFAVPFYWVVAYVFIWPIASIALGRKVSFMELLTFVVFGAIAVIVIIISWFFKLPDYYPIFGLFLKINTVLSYPIIFLAFCWKIKIMREFMQQRIF